MSERVWLTEKGTVQEVSAVAQWHEGDPEEKRIVVEHYLRAHMGEELFSRLGSGTHIVECELREQAQDPPYGALGLKHLILTCRYTPTLGDGRL
jgi:hypothetical protein